MKKILLLMAIPVFLLASTFLWSGDKTPDEKNISELLNLQVQSWNDGSLEAFMETYWNSEKLTYFSGSRPHHGWKALLERYRRTYQSEENEMGTLAFSSIDINLLGSEFALARGQWHLERKNLENLDGLFTLVLQKFPDGWKIIHDHSSSSN